MAVGQQSGKDVFFFIPHTHWEGAVFKTREAYLDMGLPNISRALALLKQHPDYRFTLDQVCYIKPFLERYPHEAAAFRRFVDEGRLAIVGGMDVMPDVNMPGGESIVRQLLCGKRYFREALGVDVTIGWPLDTFGHHPQMPQLCKLAGIQSHWFFRGAPDWGTPAEFIWEGIDGSRITAFWLPHGYAVTFGSPKTLPEFSAFFRERYDLLAPFARAPGRVGLAGADVCEPESHVPDLAEAFNQQADAPFEIRIATPADYEAWVGARADLPVLRLDLNPIFQGIYSSRIELKQRTRELERLLLTAETLQTINGWLAHPANGARRTGNLWPAWEPMLFNQTHDLMSGVMTDPVYEDTLHSYDHSRRLAEAEAQAGLNDLISRIDTQGEGVPLVVFNALSWARDDIVITPIGFAEPNVVDVSLRDPEGRLIPAQLLNVQRHDNGALLQADIAFVARDAPALGYAVYRVIPLTEPASDAPVTAQADAILENEHYRVEIDPASGAITRLVNKADGWNALSGPANVVAQEEDHGDLWEPYQPLDGGSRIAMQTPHPPPAADKAVFSNAPADTIGETFAGPVVSEFHISRPFGANGRFSTRIRLYAGLRRIDIHTQLLNNDSFVRYRALFPTSIQNGSSAQEIPFGAITRPAGIEFPAQNWVDYSDGNRGLALLNRGLPGNNVAGGTLMLSLLRSSRIVAYGFGGGYEPGMTSDTGLELGRQLDFDYALVPHSGDWRDATLYREGLAFNHPLIAVTAGAHPGLLPARRGFVEISHPNVVMTALKPGEEGGAVLRVYEATGEPAPAVRISVAAGLSAAGEVNLLEDPVAALPITDGALQLDLSPFEIKTIKLEITR